MSEPKLTVLYDGGCPMCSREIRHYRHIATGLPVQWIDVTLPTADLDSFGLSRADALRWFHVIDETGEMHVGARAFIALWTALPGYRWLARVSRVRCLATVMDIVYDRFARWHYKRRCREGICTISRP
jgi:predicted DCC family thiol-disulfide oxidoreductase YuxK